MSNNITLIKAITPKAVSKTYSVSDDGVIKKQAMANITKGKAKTVAVESAQDMVELLNKVAASTDLAICSGSWRGAQVGKSFNLLTQSELAKRVSKPQHDITELVEVKGEQYGARIKAMVEPSSWVLLDCDTPDAMPSHMATMSLSERLEALDVVVEGISKCERVELRSSSSRVSFAGQKAGEYSHAWIRISDASKLEVLRAYLRVHTIIEGVAYEQPNFSRETGAKIGSSPRTLVDLAVLDHARLTFASKPVLDPDAWELVLHEADVRIVNEGCGVLDVSTIELPDAQTMFHMNEVRGTNETLKADSGTFIFEDTDTLRDDTLIMVKGEERQLAEWVKEMREQGIDKLRCEAPFRESSSEAGILRVTDRGEVLIHDVGCNTNYKLTIDVLAMFDGVEVEQDDFTEADKDADKEAVSKSALRLAKRITIAINRSLGLARAYDETEDGEIDEEKDDGSIEFVVCDPKVVNKMLKNTFYFPTASDFLFCNNKNQLVEYSRSDVWGALVETFGSPINQVKLNTEIMKIADSMAADKINQTAINKFIKGVREMAQTMLLSYVKLYQQHKKMGISIDMFEKKARMEFSTDDVTVVFPHETLRCVTPLAKNEVLADYKEHFPNLDEFLDFIAAARFASGRKKAHLWIKATSDWGKDLLMDAIGGLGVVVKLNEKEVESAIEGKPVGKDAHNFKRALVAHFNEFKTIKSELKQLENGLTISPKHQMVQSVPLYGKVFTSAEDVNGLVTENGVENQFANRFCMFNETGSIESRPMFQRHGGGVYFQSIQRYACDELNKRITAYIQLGRLGSVRKADEDLKAFVEKHTIKNLFDTLDEQVGHIAEDFAQWVKDAFTWADKGEDFDNESGVQGLVLYDQDVRGRAINQFVHVIKSKDKEYVLITSPTTLVNRWLREMYEGSDLFVIKHKVGAIIRHLGGVVTPKDEHGRTRKGVKIEFD